MTRQPNEVLISAELMEEWLSRGNTGYEVTSGPSPEAKLIRSRMQNGWLVLEYDRDVPEVFLRAIYGQ